MTIKYIVLLFTTIIIAEGNISTSSAPELTTDASTTEATTTEASTTKASTAEANTTEASTTETSTTDRPTTLGTASTSKWSTGTSSTASTPLSATKWRSSDTTITNPVVPTTNSPINEALVLYNRLKNAVERALFQTHTFLEQLFRSSITITNNSIKDIFKISFQFFEQLDELNRKYIKIGVDISNCIELVEPGFSKLPLVLANQLTKCITPEIDVVSNYFSATIRNVTNIWDVVIKLGIKLDNCGTNNFCIIELISQMTVEFVKIPAIINTDLLKLQEYLNISTIHMGTCATSQISAATANGTEAIKTVSDCARKANV